MKNLPRPKPGDPYAALAEAVLRAYLGKDFDFGGNPFSGVAIWRRGDRKIYDQIHYFIKILETFSLLFRSGDGEAIKSLNLPYLAFLARGWSFSRPTIYKALKTAREFQGQGGELGALSHSIGVGLTELLEDKPFHAEERYREDRLYRFFGYCYRAGASRRCRSLVLLEEKTEKDTRRIATSVFLSVLVLEYYLPLVFFDVKKSTESYTLADFQVSLSKAKFLISKRKRINAMAIELLDRIGEDVFLAARERGIGNPEENYFAHLIGWKKSLALYPSVCLRSFHEEIMEELGEDSFSLGQGLFPGLGSFGQRRRSTEKRERRREDGR